MRRLVGVLALGIALLFVMPVTATALTREHAIENADRWIDQGVMYSQSRYHEGYRQDCSGFVSMCLELGDSYTTGTIDGRLDPISTSKLKPGDVMLRSGHVVMFVSWETTGSTFLCAEESRSGKPAQYDVDRVGSYKAYTLPGITTEYKLALEKKQAEEAAAKKAEADRVIDMIQNEGLFNFGFPLK